MQNTEVIPAVLPAVILGLYFEPFLNLRLMRDKICLSLQISVEERAVLHLKKLPVRIRHIDAVSQIVGGIARKEPGFLLMVNLLVVFLF